MQQISTILKQVMFKAQFVAYNPTQKLARRSIDHLSSKNAFIKQLANLRPQLLFCTKYVEVVEERIRLSLKS